MKALLKVNTKMHKAGEWAEIDTSSVFNDQYNTVAGERIFDKQVARIVDDVRDGLGRCKYCGAIVKRGEEEKHFEEQESKTCTDCGNGKKCFWYMNKYIGQEAGAVEREEHENENGEIIVTERRTVVEKYRKQCTYEDGAACCNKKHREYGIDWFTPDNTFFLKYPDGFDSISNIERLKIRGFEVKAIGRYFDIRYFKKLGSYTLEAANHADGNGNVLIDYFRVRNCRVYHNFRVENGEIYTDRYGFGWRKVKTLEKVPYNIMQAIKNICDNVTGEKENGAA